MKITQEKKKFEPCPEYVGRAVCVDCTPLEKVNTNFGVQEKFRLVFEIDEMRVYKDNTGKEIASPWTVWSTGFTPSLHQKSTLRKFIRDWFGRDLTDAEMKGFETEDLIGRPAFIMVTHIQDEKDPEIIYANIKACTPHKIGEALKPSTTYVRKKDRDKAKAGGASYKRTDSTAGAPEEAPDAYLTTKVHVGTNRGVELRELSQAAIDAIITHWLPGARSKPTQTADDRRLIAALDKYEDAKKAKEATAAVEVPAQGEDEIPMF